ncbi:MAG TPA: hypothetical protein VLB86_05455 [Gaiellaceae bacterium]|nr:hypothetical protein [Gaiellaceae bacterium]
MGAPVRVPTRAVVSVSALLALLVIVVGGPAAVGGGLPGMPHAEPRVGAPSAHLVFLGNRDGDWDVYGATSDGARVAILTRNAVDDLEVALSPTGGWLAVERPFADRSPGVSLVSTGGRRERALRPGGRAGVSGRRGAGVFSPDGRSFAFGQEVGTDETVELMLARVGDGRARRIGRGLPDGFSPDGRLLASYWDDYRVVDVRTGAGIVLAREPTSDETFSPRWTRLAYLTGTDEQEALVVVDVARELRRRVVGRGELADLSWLDERQLAFSRRVTGVDGEKTTELVVADVDSAGAVVLADGRVGAFHWSPSATAVAYVRASGDYARDDYRESLEVASVGRAGPIVLLEADGISTEFAWSASGRRIAVPSWNEGGSELVVVEAAGGGARVRVARGVYAYPVLWSPDDRALALVEDGHVAVVPAAGGRLRRLLHAGRGTVVGWMRGSLPSTAPRLPPLPALETATPTLLRVRGLVRELASDRGWAAAAVGPSRRDCDHVVAWAAGTRRVIRFSAPAPCEDDGGVGTLTALRVAGRRVTWFETIWGNYAHVAPCGGDVARPGAGGCGEETGDEEAPPRIVAPRELRRGVRIALSGGTVVLTRAADGRVRRLRPAGGAVDAELEEAGLFYAYNVRGAAMPGRVAFIPMRQLFLPR